MDMEFRFFIFSLMLIGFGNTLQQFSNQPEYTEVNPGQSVVLSCKVQDKGGQCIWQRDRRPIGMYAGKYEWAADRDSGDCSLRISNAKLDFDDGLWECQVTNSAIDVLDSLTSEPAQLVVRVPPQMVSIVYNGSHVERPGNITVQSDTNAMVQCVSAGANPVPNLRWFIGDEEISHNAYQMNSTMEGTSKSWIATSTLEFKIRRDQHNRILRCVSEHEALLEKKLETGIKLNVQYAPVVSLRTSLPADLEEGVDSASILCEADANPPATIIWRKVGSLEILGLQENLEFDPIDRNHAGSYTCEARNAIGSSELVESTVDVKYPPSDVLVFGANDGNLIVPVGGSTRLECQADAKPAPLFKWFQKTEDGMIPRGEGRFLVLSSMSYEYQGEYHCSASNIISNRERSAISSSISVKITGPPQFVPFTDQHVTVTKGEDAILRLAFCSNPKPSKITWQWGHITLEAGAGLQGRYVAEAIIKSKRANCYEARLRIQRTEQTDSRFFSLTVENEKGSDLSTLTLHVTESVSLAAVVGVIVACLMLLILVTLCLLYAFRSERCCFSSKGNLKSSSDIEKGKLDLSLSNGHNGKLSSTSSNSSIKSGKASLQYADLQLPRASNNGSMRAKSNRQKHPDYGLPSVTPVPCSPKNDTMNITNGNWPIRNIVNV
ncbi:kin of IRRE-like protein 2 isoform X2 [Artemia franciscana]|uniref:Ig-like domain-containing protein n=1 Tax=Artemia franciscana TaxID=6661 RepID=A0AA88KVV1_ARTSF|nr:hypothetical protein QYM36_012932 [Artemia franciscana]